jgi:cysteine desulfurase
MTNHKPIYLDYMATTPIDPQVIEQMLAYMGPSANFGNPSSRTHIYGQIAARAVEQARTQIAEVIGASHEDIIFTAGATEANNLAIFGAARFYQAKGRHIITMSTEHKAVLDCMTQLEREGFEVLRLNPEPDGLLNLAELERALRTDTILVSIMHVNNEIGVVQDIAAIAELLRGRGVIFHVDAAQSASKLPIELGQIPVDLMSFSAHKMYGPKGIGALYVRHKPRIRLQPILFGGGHERGLRSGTLPTHQIVGFGAAFSMAAAMREPEQARLRSLCLRLWDGIRALPSIQLNGHSEKRIAGNLNVSFAALEGINILSEMHELAISASSACMSGRDEASHVLSALGISRARALSSMRLSLGRYTTEHEVDTTIEVIQRVIRRLMKQ